MEDLRVARFRASPRHRLVPAEQLSESTRRALGGLVREPGFYGLLEPLAGSARGLRAVTVDTAALLGHLETPRRLSNRVLQRLGDRADALLARLVLDDVLEVLADGVFVSGVGATRALLGPVEPSRAEEGLAALSLAALRHVETIGSRDVREVSKKLYRFNTRPASPEWWNRLPDRRAVAVFLEVDRFGGSAALLAAHETHDDGTVRRPWYQWRSDAEPRETTYKLYVSPEPEYSGRALRAVSGVIGEEPGAFAVKVGRDLYGLLRPDKLVIYFDRFETLERTARRLQRELTGMPAQGVPFTADLGAEGLLSWGADPPAAGASPSWIGEESWRLWLTNRLAAALVAAQGDGDADIPAWWFAVKRIELEGIDPATWAPQPGWSGGAVDLE